MLNNIRFDFLCSYRNNSILVEKEIILYKKKLVRAYLFVDGIVYTCNSEKKYIQVLSLGLWVLYLFHTWYVSCLSEY